MAQLPTQPQSRDDFRVAIFCALPVESEMVRRVFDREWKGSTVWSRKARGDRNTYTAGLIGQHNVVIVHMPGAGSIAAANALTGLRASFPGVEIAFVVGVCGASPQIPQTQEEICLGDCIVSTALVQYDFGRQHPGGFLRKTDIEDTLGRADPAIRSLLAKLQTAQTRRSLERNLALHLQSLQQGDSKVPFPGLHRDCLFDATYQHVHHDTDQFCSNCIQEVGVCSLNCDEIGCDRGQSIHRRRLAISQLSGDQGLPRLYFGRYGSANMVLKSGVDRDRLIKTDELLAFEMEAAGLWESLPTLVVKSACDYADSHKSKEWQTYAAATAAAGLKAILDNYNTSDHSLVQDNKYNVPFTLEGVPVAKKFIERPAEMHRIEQALLPTLASSNRGSRRRIFVLRGLGGIGKTQLAVEFMRLHHTEFSAVLWLDGSSKDSLKQSIVQHAGRIALERASDGSVEDIIADFTEWLRRPDNSEWLLVFDNIDREHLESDPLSYDINQYIPSTDHGSILITTRLTQLEQLGESQEVKKVDNETAEAILNNWHSLSGGKFRPSHALCIATDLLVDKTNIEALLRRLDGLPLAISQAGSYLQRTGVGIDTYLRLYDAQHATVGEALHGAGILLDYPNRSVSTTWNLSYTAVRQKAENVANLLVLWSYLDRNDLWFGLLKAAATKSRSTTEALSHTLGDIAKDELSFIKAMEILRGYSLIEGSGTESTGGYMMHAALHRWLYFLHGTKHKSDLGFLALRVVGFAMPSWTQRDRSQLQQRLLPHANMCSTMILDSDLLSPRNHDRDDPRIDRSAWQAVLVAAHKVSLLYYDLGKFEQAEKMLVQVLISKEATLGANHESTLNSVDRLASLYRRFERLDEAEKMGQRTLTGLEEIFGPKHRSTLGACSNLGMIYVKQDRLDEAEKMFLRALVGLEETPGANDSYRSNAMTNLGAVYYLRNNLDEAEKYYLSAIEIMNKMLGPKHRETLSTINKLGLLYEKQGKPEKAEETLLSILHGYEEMFSAEHLKTCLPASNALSGLGDLYFESRPEEARVMYERALEICTMVLGASHKRCAHMERRLRKLDMRQTQSVEDSVDIKSSHKILQAGDYSEDDYRSSFAGPASLLQKTEMRMPTRNR